jgi:hypothetical protein
MGLFKRHINHIETNPWAGDVYLFSSMFIYRRVGSRQSIFYIHALFGFSLAEEIIMFTFICICFHTAAVAKLNNPPICVLFYVNQSLRTFGVEDAV